MEGEVSWPVFHLEGDMFDEVLTSLHVAANDFGVSARAGYNAEDATVAALSWATAAASHGVLKEVLGMSRWQSQRVEAILP
jgi:hypothetical protein